MLLLLLLAAAAFFPRGPTPRPVGTIRRRTRTGSARHSITSIRNLCHVKNAWVVRVRSPFQMEGRRRSEETFTSLRIHPICSQIGGRVPTGTTLTRN
ncbi:hypothetical protein BC827DRAFT_576774 [Russula dissimulans]|nr:hypothetical protein BC827DRAFT_576774 [Russula dissimulans]